MAIDVSGLSKYVDEQSGELIRKAVLGGRTADIFNVMGGVKHSQTINILNSPAVGAAGSCGFSSNNSTVLSQRTMTVDSVKVNEEICLDTLEDYFVSTKMNPGSYNEELPFEAIYAEEKSAQIAKMIESQIWAGNKDTGTGNAALVDGFIKLWSTTESGSTVNGNTSSATATTVSNIITQIDDMIAAVPDDVIDAGDLKLMLSYANYRLYARALRNADLYHNTGKEGTDFRMMAEGTNVEIVATAGLVGRSEMYLTSASNAQIGTDLLSDADAFKIFYSEDNDIVRVIAKYKLGVECVAPEHVVRFDFN